MFKRNLTPAVTRPTLCITAKGNFDNTLTPLILFNQIVIWIESIAFVVSNIASLTPESPPCPYPN